MKIYYPKHVDKIMHISKDGEVYQLDSFWKMKRVKEKLEKNYSITEVDESIDEGVLLRFHTSDFVKALITGENREKFIESSGVFWQPRLPSAMFNKAKAMQYALENLFGKDNLSIAIADGGHHTTPSRALGFGAINAVGVAIANVTQSKGEKIAILDLDVHQGNGFSFIEGERIKIFDVWGQKLSKWPVNTKSKNYRDYNVSSVDEYQSVFKKVLEDVIDWGPSFLIYYSGVDVLETDRMRGITGFTEQMFKNRERKVFDTLSKENIKLLLVLGGGYVNYDKGSIQEEKSKLISRHLYTTSYAIKSFK